MRNSKIIGAAFAASILILTAPPVLAQTRAVQAQIDPCSIDKKSAQCVRAERQRNAEAISRVKGLPRNYRPSRTGDSSMQDLTSPTPAPQITTFTARRSSGLVRRSATDTITAAPSSGRAAVGVQGATELAGQGLTFDEDLFAQNIRNVLNGNTAGYAFAISKGGQLAVQDGDGKLRKAGEGNIDQSPTLRQNIASISKMITAVAVLQLMDELNLDIDDKIAPYLPDSWTLGANVDDLTFEHLLRHRTGFTSSNSDFWNTLSWNGLSTMVAGGANPGAPFNYLNANFALFRFIIPAMWKETGSPYGIYTENGTAAAFWYIFYLQENVFGPIGVDMAQCVDPTSSTEALYYDAAANLNGVPGGDWNMICGSGGWVLSANDLVNFMTNFLYNDQILSPQMRDLMMDNQLGVYRTAGARGDYYSHSGVIGWTGGQGMVMCLMRFSIAVEAAVLVNSPVNGVPGNQFCNTVLRDTFDAAWN